jgi:hypothetical protein
MSAAFRRHAPLGDAFRWSSVPHSGGYPADFVMRRGPRCVGRGARGRLYACVPPRRDARRRVRRIDPAVLPTSTAELIDGVWLAVAVSL